MQKLERELLLSACKKGDVDTVMRLSGDVSVPDSDGYSTLHIAARLVDNVVSKAIAKIYKCGVHSICNSVQELYITSVLGTCVLSTW